MNKLVRGYATCRYVRSNPSENNVWLITAASLYYVLSVLQFLKACKVIINLRQASSKCSIAFNCGGGMPQRMPKECDSVILLFQRARTIYSTVLLASYFEDLQGPLNHITGPASFSPPSVNKGKNNLGPSLAPENPIVLYGTCTVLHNGRKEGSYWASNKAC